MRKKKIESTYMWTYREIKEEEKREDIHKVRNCCQIHR